MHSPRKSSTGNCRVIANEERYQCRNRNEQDGFHGQLAIDELRLIVSVGERPAQKVYPKLLPIASGLHRAGRR